MAIRSLTSAGHETNGMIERLHGQLVYLDANVFIYALEDHPDFSRPARELFGALNAGTIRGLTSELTLAEVLVLPLRQNKHELVAAHEKLLSTKTIAALPVTRSVLREAAQIRAATGQKLPDSIHAATACLAHCTAIVSQDMQLSAPGLKSVSLAELISPGPNS